MRPSFVSYEKFSVADKPRSGRAVWMIDHTENKFGPKDFFLTGLANQDAV
jgi:hypothetical protein